MRIGPHVGTEQYGISSASPGLTARPPGTTDNDSPRRRACPRIFYSARAYIARHWLRTA
jgi:hypothetical protein